MRHRFTALALLGASLLPITACQPAEAETEMVSAEAARADLQRLYEGLQSAEANLFVTTPKRVFDKLYEVLLAQYTAPVSEAQLHKDFQRFAALADHGHTRIEGRNPGWAPYADEDGLVFPLRLRIENGEVIVIGAPEGGDIAPGDRIRALNGEPNPIWLNRIMQHVSAETPEVAYSLISGGEHYYTWLEYGPQEKFEFKIERDGVLKTVEVDAIPVSEFGALETSESGIDLSGREARMLTEEIGYLRPGPFYNTDATTAEEAYDPDALAAFKSFIDEAYEGFIEAGIEHLVLDLRDNPGGDNSFSDPVVAWFADEPFSFASDFRIRVSPETTASNQARIDALPEGSQSLSVRMGELFAGAENGDMVSFEIPHAAPREGQRFEGEVHVLVNRYSYSNAVSTAALIQDYGFGKIYGEPTRDMATTYGAMEHFELPNSGFVVGYPKAHIIRPNGELKSHPLTPDVRLPVPSITSSEDVTLNALIDRLSEN